MFYKNLNISLKKIVFPFIIFCLILLNFGSINAEEPAPDGFKNISSENSGKFKSILQMSPPDPIAGPVKFALILKDSNTNLPIEDAKVNFFAETQDEPKQYTIGLNSPKFKNIYIGMLELEKPGDWIIEASIKTNNAETNIITPIIVKKRSRSDNYFSGNILFIAVTLAFIAIPLWLRRESKKALSKRKS